MQRKYALATAGFLTTVVMGTALTLTALAAAPSTSLAGTGGRNLTMAAVQPAQPGQSGQSVTWNQQIEQGKVLFAALDAEAQPQITDFKQQLSGLEKDAVARLSRMDALQQEIETAQAAIQQDAQTYQTQIAQMQTLDTGWQQQVADASNQLQAAFDALGQSQLNQNGPSNNHEERGRFSATEREHEGEDHEENEGSD